MAWHRPGRPCHDLSGMEPSTPIVTVTLTAVAAARAPDTHRSNGCFDVPSYGVCASCTARDPQSYMALCSPIKHAKHTQWYVVSVLSKQESHGYLWNKLWSAHSPKRLRDVCDGTSSEGIRSNRRRARQQPMQI